MRSYNSAERYDRSTKREGMIDGRLLVQTDSVRHTELRIPLPRAGEHSSKGKRYTPWTEPGRSRVGLAGILRSCVLAWGKKAAYPAEDFQQ
jgi:hypothetical protein